MGISSKEKRGPGEWLIISRITFSMLKSAPVPRAGNQAKVAGGLHGSTLSMCMDA